MCYEIYFTFLKAVKCAWPLEITVRKNYLECINFSSERNELRLYPVQQRNWAIGMFTAVLAKDVVSYLSEFEKIPGKDLSWKYPQQTAIRGDFSSTQAELIITPLFQ